MEINLKKRLLAFYIGGVINGVLGLYVLIDGGTFLEPGTARTLILVFLTFAVVDFYFAYLIKKKASDQTRTPDQSSGGPVKGP